MRRITGGGGLYFDEGQIGWELVFDRATFGPLDLAEVTRRICEAAALGLNKLGVPARYRPRNDLEVDGRKISGTGGFFDGNIIFYQGTLLIDFDPGKIAACLNIPAEKLAKRDLQSAAQRIITMREVLGDKLPDLKTIYEGLLAGFAEGLGIDAAMGRHHALRGRARRQGLPRGDRHRRLCRDARRAACRRRPRSAPPSPAAAAPCAPTSGWRGRSSISSARC